MAAPRRDRLGLDRAAARQVLLETALGMILGAPAGRLLVWASADIVQ